MARGPRHGPRPRPIDMGGNEIQQLGRSTADDGAARIDDIADHVTLPKPPGIADPGVNPIASPSDHVHGGEDTAGGDLYLIDDVEAVPIVYYATDIIPYPYANPVLGIAPSGAWDLSCMVTTGSNLGGY